MSEDVVAGEAMNFVLCCGNTGWFCKEVRHFAATLPGNLLYPLALTGACSPGPFG
jgi:hypothetical protein